MCVFDTVDEREEKKTARNWENFKEAGKMNTMACKYKWEASL